MTNPRVLIVDDDRDTCQCLTDILECDGYQVVAKTNASQAVNPPRKQDLHGVVLDLVMPQVSGLDLLPVIRDIDSDVAIVILTGYPTVETARASIDHEVSAHIKRPFSVEEMRGAIDRVAKKKGLVLRGEDTLRQSTGNKIRGLRKKKGLTLRQTARRTSLSAAQLSMHRARRVAALGSVVALCKLAAAPDVKLADLLGDH